jgi:hypothetical protein
VREVETEEAGGKCEENRRYTDYWWKNLKKTDYFYDLVLCERIILNWILKK